MVVVGTEGSLVRVISDGRARQPYIGLHGGPPPLKDQCSTRLPDEQEKSSIRVTTACVARHQLQHAINVLLVTGMEFRLGDPHHLCRSVLDLQVRVTPYIRLAAGIVASSRKLNGKVVR